MRKCLLVWVCFWKSFVLKMEVKEIFLKRLFWVLIVIVGYLESSGIEKY